MPTFAFQCGPQASGLPRCLLQPSLVESSASHLASLGNGLLRLFWALPPRPGLSGKKGGCPSFRDAAEGTASSLQSPQTGLSSAHTPWRRLHFPGTEKYAKYKTKQTRRWLLRPRPEWGEDGPQDKGDSPGLIGCTRGGLTFGGWGTPPGKQLSETDSPKTFPPDRLCTFRSKRNILKYIHHVYSCMYLHTVYIVPIF